MTTEGHTNALLSRSNSYAPVSQVEHLKKLRGNGKMPTVFHSVSERNVCVCIKKSIGTKFAPLVTLLPQFKKDKWLWSVLNSVCNANMEGKGEMCVYVCAAYSQQQWGDVSQSVTELHHNV